MKTPILCMHAGSGNHGCEAIVAATLRLMESSLPEALFPPILVTHSLAEDERYSLKDLEKRYGLVILEENHLWDHKLLHALYYLYRKVTGDRESFLRYRFKPLFSYLKTKGITGDNAVIYCVGGDNYCYPDMVPDLILANRVFHKKGFSTILLGASLEPASLSSEALREDLFSYQKITVRESLSFDALKGAGIPEKKITLCPDPAFTLTRKDLPLPQGFEEGKTVGINVSPLVFKSETKPGITMENFRRLIRHILESSNARVALIPHVVWPSSDDLGPLRELYRAFRETERVVLIGDHSCQELKGFIGRCSLFVGARTHATIAAYSSCVPTLVLGYSVKSRGIARDLFGSPDHYVLPVQELRDPEDLVKAYDFLLANAGDIKERLQREMPGIIRRAKNNAES